MPDLIAERKWRHELKRATKRRHGRYQDSLKRQTGKSPRKALWHSSKAERWKPMKRSAFKRLGVPRDKAQ